ncbi:uncharacterized protein LOC104431430 [Eucalyptus grandis]|uniref:uncharacterized protein LOC104431430 n=1 Tax=Eucalyptus grandis TaxID=71139 RepID=UPI00192ED1D7|nr:uncharacterized protein LOC104431430 [Eucalyptus grandis]
MGGLSSWILYRKEAPYQLTQDTLKHVWGEELVEVIAADMGFYYLRIPNEEFRKKILEGGLIMVAKIQLILHQWHPKMELKKDCHNSVPIWIRLRNVPVVCWSAPGLSTLASALGKPLFVDSRTEQMAMVAFARICVEIDASSSFPEVIKFSLNGESRSIDVHYEWVPTICPSCCTFGHRCAMPGELKSKSGCADANPTSVRPENEWREVRGKRNNRPLIQPENPPPSPSTMVPPQSEGQDSGKSSSDSSSSDEEGVDETTSGKSDSDSPLVVASSILEETISPPSLPDPLIDVPVRLKGPLRYASADATQAIHGGLLCLNSGSSFNLFVIYAEHSFVLRRPLWNELMRLSLVLSNSPWIIAGDFNAIRDASDRADSSNYWIPSFNDFGECLAEAGLEDLRYVGNRFTWATSSGLNRRLRKIDRVLINSAWNSMFSFSEASFLAQGVSDHCPMVVRIMPVPNTRKPFKFFNFWMSHPSFFDMVLHTWNSEFPGTSMYSLCCKLRALKCRLKHLNRMAYADITMRTDEARAQLSLAQEAIQLDPFNRGPRRIREKEKLQIFFDLRLQEESFYRQKSRVRWLKEGDLNTKFFHQSVKQSHLRNRIISIHDGERLVSHPPEVHQLFISHFQDLLAASPPSAVPLVAEIQEKLMHTLNDIQIQELSHPVSDEEIRSTLFSLASGKSPGPRWL